LGIWFSRGLAYADLGDRDRAIADYTRAIELKPDNAPYLCNRGNALFGNNDYEHAMADYDEAIRIDPVCYYNRGTAYARHHDADRALADFDLQWRLTSPALPL
jgi:tetratricopeptide (TPR) repeat protein